MGIAIICLYGDSHLLREVFEIMDCMIETNKKAIEI